MALRKHPQDLASGWGVGNEQGRQHNTEEEGGNTDETRER